jgi:hypothetical protein
MCEYCGCQAITAIDELTREHDLVVTLIGEARHAGDAATTTPADPTWRDRLTTALDDLREHILKEQDGVFPTALANLGTDDWAAVDAVRARAGAPQARAFPPLV